jgi:hypothetical protein
VVRAALSAQLAIALVLGVAFAAQPGDSPAAAIADVLIWGKPMPAAESLQPLPRDVQQRAAECRERERTFHSTLTAPRGATDVERDVFAKRTAIERVLFCLFARRDIARVAAQYAADADVASEWDGEADLPRREAAFIDELLHDASKPWLAPYLNLIAAHRKLCASELAIRETDAERSAMQEAARRQLTQARDGGHPLIRVAAEYLLTTSARSCTPSP